MTDVGIHRIGFAVAIALALTLNADAQSNRSGQKIIGRHGNGWNGAAVAVNGVTPAIDSNTLPYCTAFGNTSAAATLTVQVSGDSTNWYTSTITTGAVTGNFVLNFTVGARYVRLVSNAAATITATIQCKAGG
jgi:hypothetical protein